jgi:hypothetical protein
MLYGTVYSAITGEPLPATVTVAGCGSSVTTATGSDGSWKLNYAYGHTGRITFSAPGYVSQTFEITLNVQWFYAGGSLSLQPLIR